MGLNYTLTASTDTPTSSIGTLIVSTDTLMASIGPFMALTMVSWLLLFNSKQRWASTLANRLNVQQSTSIKYQSPLPPPRCMYPKCGNLCGQKGQEAIHS